MKFDHAADAISGIDHTLVGVRDLEVARGTWQALGFTVTPRGRHIGWGTGNYCIMLESGYIELLGVVDPSQFLNNLDGFLQKREILLRGFRPLVRVLAQHGDAAEHGFVDR